MNVLFIILSMVIGIIIVLGLITLHEFGHFLVAKWSKAYVFEFAIGFGPKLFVIKGKETWYSVRLIPLGGYVSIASDFAEPPKGREEEFDLIPDWRKIDYAIKWKKTLFIFFGPFLNLVLAFILICSLFMSVGYKENDINFYGQRFSENSIAYKMIAENEKDKVFNQNSQSIAIIEWRIQVDGDNDSKKIDKIINHQEGQAPKYIDIVNSFINGLKPINAYINGREDFYNNVSFGFTYVYLENNYSGKIKSNEDPREVELKKVTSDKHKEIIEMWKQNKAISVGVYPPNRYFKNVGSAFGYSFVETWNQSVSLLTGLGKFFTGDFNAIGGPVGMIKNSTSSTGVSTNYVLYISSISANLFMLNMLPFPPLDGYKFFETLVEWITRKEVNKKTKTIIYTVGAVLLLTLIIVVTIKDIII